MPHFGELIGDSSDSQPVLLLYTQSGELITTLSGETLAVETS